MLTQVNHPQQQLDICDDRLLNLSIRFYAGLITPESEIHEGKHRCSNEFTHVSHSGFRTI